MSLGQTPWTPGRAETRGLAQRPVPVLIPAGSSFFFSFFFFFNAKITKLPLITWWLERGCEIHLTLQKRPVGPVVSELAPSLPFWRKRSLGSDHWANSHQIKYTNHASVNSINTKRIVVGIVWALVGAQILTEVGLRF